MTNLPVREMVLYKHGVGFFVREGQTDSQEVALTFREDEINDVLKSLAVFDRAGGHVLGIYYQTPMDKQARLANSSIRLSDHATLYELVSQLRGREVTLTFESVPGTLENVAGRVVGVDGLIQQQRALGIAIPNDESLISILVEDGNVRVFRFNALRTVSIQNPQASYDLTYFLDTSMMEDTRRTVNVRLSEGSHELVVYYVAPSPTWRVSYRIVAETDKDRASGTALLQGWGLFDNRLEEDLENVKVTLVAGQPISFIYELYASRIPKRPTVQDESRIAPGPIEFEGAPNWDNEVGIVYDEVVTNDNVEARPRFKSGAKSSAPIMARMEIAQSAPAVAKPKDTGETFQYAVTTPVSVKRGESALVPILNAEVKYERELLYNGAKLPNHPVAALRFTNSTDLTLERGPVTLVENGDYRGEAVVPFSKHGSQVYLPYAVELGIKVIEHVGLRNETIGMSITAKYLIFETYSISTTTYVIENTTNKQRTITLESSLLSAYEPFDMPPADVETATDRRWKVKVPARAKVEFVRKERVKTHRHEEVRHLTYQNLQKYLENRWLDQATFDALDEILKNFALIKDAQAKKTHITNERSAIYTQQEQLRANIGALQPVGQEAAFRSRLLNQLEATQNRLDAIDREIAALNVKITQVNSEADRLIEQLGQNAN